MLINLRRIFSIVSVAAVVFLLGCSMDESKKKVSSSADDLHKIVDMPFAAKSIQWEIFGTPEHHGGVPGPTDFITLIAELKQVDENWHRGLPNEEGNEFIVPGAVRPWLSSSFRALLLKHENARLALPSATDCRPYKSRLKKSSAPVKGFICRNADRALIYLTFSAFS